MGGKHWARINRALKSLISFLLASKQPLGRGMDSKLQLHRLHWGLRPSPIWNMAGTETQTRASFLPASPPWVEKRGGLREEGWNKTLGTTGEPG